MKSSIIKNLEEVKDLLNGISEDHYSNKLEVLSGASIGQHLRHILEFYQCLFLGYKSGVVNYDSRKRDLQLESDLSFAISNIEIIINQLLEVKQDFDLVLVANYSTDESTDEKIKTSFYRELAYNLEHSIHHQALIKIAITEMKLTGLVNSEFGFAPSTIRFNNQNVHSNLHTN